MTGVLGDGTDRRLSPWRVLLGLVVVGGAVAALALRPAGIMGSASAEGESQRWFAAYVDVTATPRFAFESAGDPSVDDVVLSFVVADPADPCLPSWGGVHGLEEAATALDLDRRVARLTGAGGGVVVSFGGARNAELATVCADPDRLLAAYRAVVTRYDLSTVDLDLEGAALTDPAASRRRALAVAALQQERAAAGSPLAVWVTLPVTTAGLSTEGAAVVGHLLAAGVELTGVNVMTMDFGEPAARASMADAAIAALGQVHRQLGVLYGRVGVRLGDETRWHKLGATPMIGRNDLPGEVLTLADAARIHDFALAHGLGRLSMWSLNRDTSCGSNYAELAVVSDACSGVDQHGASYAAVLAEGYAGDPANGAGVATTEEPVDPRDLVDDPATSPYPVWSPTASYPRDTKVVWHRHVYVATWWTTGDVPDDPVLNAWETPWRLVGPVLPGEHPVPPPTLPAGTYPAWSGTRVYVEGRRVLLDGVPYVARWWNRAESPQQSATDPDSSPWEPLSAEEIEEVRLHLGG